MRFLKAPCSVLVDSLGAWRPFCRWPTDLSACCCLESGVQTPCPWRSHHTLHCVLSNLARTDADATHKRPESGQASLPSLWGGGGFQQGAEVHGGEPGAPAWMPALISLEMKRRQNTHRHLFAKGRPFAQAVPTCGSVSVNRPFCW